MKKQIVSDISYEFAKSLVQNIYGIGNDVMGIPMVMNRVANGDNSSFPRGVYVGRWNISVNLTSGAPMFQIDFNCFASILESSPLFRIQNADEFNFFQPVDVVGCFDDIQLNFQGSPICVNFIGWRFQIP